MQAGHIRDMAIVGFGAAVIPVGLALSYRYDEAVLLLSLALFAPLSLMLLAFLAFTAALVPVGPWRTAFRTVALAACGTFLASTLLVLILMIA